jgi:TolB-like protein
MLLLLFLSGLGLAASCGGGSGSTVSPDGERGAAAARAPVVPSTERLVIRTPVDQGERWLGLALEGTPRGLRVLAVEHRSPAARAEVQAGDVLVRVGERAIPTVETLLRVLEAVRVGLSVPLELERGGRVITVPVLAEDLPAVRVSPAYELRDVIDIASDGASLWGWGTTPAWRGDRGFLPVLLPGRPVPTYGGRPIGGPITDRVLAVDADRVYLGWAISELYVDAYEHGGGRISRLPVRGAERLANRCRARGLTRVDDELWMACHTPDGPMLARIRLDSGQTSLETLPATYWSGLAHDGEAMLWLCCPRAGRVSLARTDLASGITRTFPLPGVMQRVAADPQGTYLLGGGTVYRVRLYAPGGLRASVHQLADRLAESAPGGRVLRVAVSEFPDLDGVTSELGRYVAERLTTRLSRHRDRFRLVERRRLAQVFEELRFKLSALADPSKVQEVGRLLGVDALVTGTVSELGRSVDVDARIVEVDTMAVVAGAHVSVSRGDPAVELLERGRSRAGE